MNQSFSTTQVSNIVVIASMLVILAKNFDFVLSMEDATTIVSFFAILAAGIVSYVNKHKKGETNLFGAHKF